MKTRQLTMDAALAAMCAALGAVSIDLGNIKFSFESLPMIIGALLFGPVDGLLIGGIGTFLYQFLRYGLTVTTPLWILPYVLCGLIVGLYAKKRGFNLERWQLGLIITLSSLMIFVLNTGVLYVDSKIYGYYSFVYIFGSITARFFVCLVKAAAFTAVTPTLINAARRVLK